MKSRLAILIVTIAVLIPSYPAFAIDGDKAIELCKKNKKCTYGIQTNGEVTLFVEDSFILCPLIGECVCVKCPGPAKVVKPGKAKDVMSVPKVLQKTQSP